MSHIGPTPRLWCAATIRVLGLIFAVQQGVAAGAGILTWWQNNRGPSYIGGGGQGGGNGIFTPSPPPAPGPVVFSDDAFEFTRLWQYFGDNLVWFIVAGVAVVYAHRIANFIFGRANACPSCGYSTKNARGRCPECGTQLTASASASS